MRSKLIDTALLQQLRVLSTVVSEKSVAAAAKRLNVSQPAVSNALARLRDKTGDPLIVKVGNRSVPTARALQIAQVSSPALAAMMSVVGASTSFNPASATGTVRVGMPDYLEHILAADLCCAIQAVAPNLTLIMRGCNADTVSGQLDSGDLDLGLTMVKSVPAWQLATVMFEEQFVCLVPRQLAPKQKNLSPTAFLEHSHAIVSFQGNTKGQIDLALAQLGKQRQVVATATSFSTLGAMLHRGNLIACVPHPIAHYLANTFDLRIFPLPVEVPPIQVSLCEARARSNEGMLAWVRQQLIQCIETKAELHQITNKNPEISHRSSRR
jgi:LysR family transcriptional regulator, mexEF-oprN operon transcriptional activator